MVDKVVEQPEHSGSSTVANGAGEVKKKSKKLKGKRAVVRWLKLFRFKKKKEYERMTAEEKILYKMRKDRMSKRQIGTVRRIEDLYVVESLHLHMTTSPTAFFSFHPALYLYMRLMVDPGIFLFQARKKEERYVEALKKIEPKESSETTHDPEILTPEEHFYFLKLGIKSKNYVPVGRRGIYQGVILNMHLHWKKHQTLKVVVKTFSPEEVKEIAAELARLSGGIVLDIQEENTIIMYRGKNYSQPPTEIMSPRSTLSRKKALDKSKYRDGLRSVRKYIPRLEQDLELLHAKAENKTNIVEETLSTGIDSVDSGNISKLQLGDSDKLKLLMAKNEECPEYDPASESGMCSDSEDLSDIFETDSDTENEKKTERPLYLDEFEKLLVQTDEMEDFEEHLSQMSADPVKGKSVGKDEELPDLDEVDQMFLQAASLLKKKRSKR
ncbi:uncharacterized CRM domain-containing protein At3g25440, chloroplastic isoform X4 [Camellia sinensis]|nr:uncharacterized CRM domain-containing protein At3g25440, chloroplastic isoform X4 [Camellia sinensis]XP_028120625.1 uncharacterized CRM domain-containing protein At3g25440, chloroplastic isoform X4 [Camellia sinensis]